MWFLWKFLKFSWKQRIFLAEVAISHESKLMTENFIDFSKALSQTSFCYAFLKSAKDIRRNQLAGKVSLKRDGCMFGVEIEI